MSLQFSEVLCCVLLATVESHYNESQGTLEILSVSEIHYNQIDFHSRPLNWDTRICSLYQIFTVRVFFITNVHCVRIIVFDSVVSTHLTVLTTTCSVPNGEDLYYSDIGRSSLV